MEVTCERCGTEYEFDDALVSERGTTVQCTNCGLQFRVRRHAPQGAGAASDLWLVRSTNGDEHPFQALRELQAAIANGLVTRDDVLERSGSRPRRLGSIAELEPFFTQKSSVRITKTLPPPSLSVSSPVRYDVSVAMPLPRAPAELPGAPDSLADTALMPARGARRSDLPPLNPPPTGFARSTPLPPPAALPPPTVVGRPIHSVGAEPEPSSEDQIRTQERPRVAADPPPPVEVPKAQAALGREAGAVPSGLPIPTPTPPEIRLGSSMDEAFGDPRYAPPPYSSRKAGGSARWVVGTIVVGALLFTAVVFGRRYLATATPGANDPRVTQLVSEGERAIAEGDLEAAKEQLDKASALAEKDPKVAAALARLGVLRAEVPWLKARIVTGKADIDAAQRELETAGTRTRKAADLAFALSTEDPSVLRSRVDSLRIASDLDAARSLVGRLPSPDDPETAVTIAALDLAQGKPKDPQGVVKRLRGAVSAEGQLGRARALLVYALVLAGDGAGAKEEAEKLSAGAHPHPLALLLKAYAESGGAVDPTSLPDATDVPSDPKAALADAKKAFEKGELGRAEKLYQGVLKKQPDSVDAMVGLAHVLTKKGDKKAAEKMFEQALKKDAKSLPAMAGLADLKWDSGDKAGAGALYKQIAAAGSSPFEERAKERAKEAPPPPAPGKAPPASTGEEGRVPDDFVWTPEVKKPPPPEPKPE